VTPAHGAAQKRPEKWREQNPTEIRRILLLVAATEHRLGY